MQLDLIVGLATELVKLANKPDAVKAINRITDLKKDIDEEKARGQLADWGRIETWTKGLETETQGLLMLFAAKGLQ